MVPLRSISIFTFGFLLLFLCSSLAEQQQFAVDGKVLELDESNFEAAISTFDYMFVDFYAPWCGHCKRLSPELDKASVNLAVLKQPVVIAKVDADKYSRLASKYEIDGFPTLKIFMHGVPTDYYGPRKADLLVRFLKKFVAPDVSVLNSDSAISEFIEEAGKNFPIFIGFGLNESVISHLAVKYKKSAWFSVAKDFSDKTMEFYDFDKVPALVALHLTYNEQSIFYGPFEEKFLEDYIKQSLLPLVLSINQDTLKSLKDDKRKIVLTIVEDEDDERSKGLVKLLKAAASANRDLVFAFVGFKQWQDFAESFEVSKKIKLPKMIVWDGDVEYFSVIGSDSVEDEDQGSQITRFLKGYREGSVIQKHIISDDYKAFRNSMFLIGALILVLVVILVSMMMQSVKEEPSREQVDHPGSSTSLSEARVALRSGDKEDKID
ncbi:protein disulfide-isomerase 5-2-like [Solanum tuberosum]|uniref:Protein disulfide isomerase n=1 Tax=Solanum tuberosum TaxID=4113 RepID=M1CN22_SOLTU|nr:PREDICTED: protein disulfide-isomerase 5-2-like [Solanum tuberosum]